MHRAAPPALLLLAALGFTPAASGGEPAASFDGRVRPLLDAHCIDCHGADAQKAGLRLDTLAADLGDDAAAAAWVRVFDKLAAGEMPPKKSQRPPQADLDAATRFLNGQLHAASLERQQKKGRVVVRRLNGTEYENTLHDLLGTTVALKECCPRTTRPPASTTSAPRWTCRATHLLLYQEAAAKAVPPSCRSTRRSRSATRAPAGR